MRYVDGLAGGTERGRRGESSTRTAYSLLVTASEGTAINGRRKGTVCGMFRTRSRVLAAIEWTVPYAVRRAREANKMDRVAGFGTVAWFPLYSMLNCKDTTCGMSNERAV
jgi:hypothetical protein